MPDGKERLTEFEVKKRIIAYLKKRGIFHWSDYQPVGKPGKGHSRGKNGVSDLLGIYKGKPLAIEVKKYNGEVSQTQFQWLKEFERQGGIAIVARSVEDVERHLT